MVTTACHCLVMMVQQIGYHTKSYLWSLVGIAGFVNVTQKAPLLEIGPKSFTTPLPCNLTSSSATRSKVVPSLCQQPPQISHPEIEIELQIISTGRYQCIVNQKSCSVKAIIAGDGLPDNLRWICSQIFGCFHPLLWDHALPTTKHHLRCEDPASSALCCLQIS